MNIVTANALLPLRRRLDWRQSRLSYVPQLLYELRETRRMRLLRRFAAEFRRFGRRML